MINIQNLRNVDAGEVCTFSPVAGIVVNMFRSAKYLGPRDGITGFRPDKILKNDAVVWSFKEMFEGSGKVAEILEYGDDEQIIVVRDKATVYEIVRIADFAHATVAVFGDKVIMVGGSSKETLLDIKIAAAEVLGLSYWYSDKEGQILNVRAEQARNARQAIKDNDGAEKAKKEEARLKREQFRADILSRPTVEAWSHKGQHFFGLPVTNDAEWMCLKDGTHCIMMKNGQPVAAFIVMKKGNTLKQVHQYEVSANKPEPKTLAKSVIPVAIDLRSITLRNETRDDVLIFNSVDDVRKLQAAGLNSGTWVGVLPEGSDTLTVYGVTSNGFNPVGTLKKKIAQATA